MQSKTLPDALANTPNVASRYIGRQHTHTHTKQCFVTYLSCLITSASCLASLAARSADSRSSSAARRRSSTSARRVDASSIATADLASWARRASSSSSFRSVFFKVYILCRTHIFVRSIKYKWLSWGYGRMTVDVGGRRAGVGGGDSRQKYI